MGKTDIESAFRLIPVHADDWELLATFWNGQYYFDKVLPFGLLSAPCIFNQLSDAIEWILLNECSISFVCHILDDFLIAEPPCSNPPLDSRCRASLLSMILTFKTLNIPISASKSDGPSQIIQFMGIILDSRKMEARLTVDKVERIKGALSSFQSLRSTTLQELQSLIGNLNFACKVIAPERPFLERIIHLSRGVIACVAGGIRERASVLLRAKPGRNSRAAKPRVKFPPATFVIVFACRPLLALLMNQLNKPIRERSI